MKANAPLAERSISYRTKGFNQGPITRLVSPSGLGEDLKPFVFLDIFNVSPDRLDGGFGMHPHSGIATVTCLIEGDVQYEDTTGAKGILPRGGVEWMQAGRGVWHSARPVSKSAVLGVQLWLALPPKLENAPAKSIYLAPLEIPSIGPARLLLGRHEGVSSSLNYLEDINYLSVELKKGESWHYAVPPGHIVAWALPVIGMLHAVETIDEGELVIFEESELDIKFSALDDCTFFVGSGVKHPYDLVTGNYSVHTSDGALAFGEAEISRIGRGLYR